MDDKALMLQSLKTAYVFLDGAEKILSLKRGEDYAAAHPEVVGHFMLTAALEFHAHRSADLMGDIAGSLGRLSASFETFTAGKI